MKSRTIAASLPLAALMMAGSPASGGETATTTNVPKAAAPVPVVIAKSETGPSLVPEDFPVPTSAEGPGFKIAPLGPEVVTVDFDAYMSSVEHLQTTFTRSTAWPHKDISQADAMRDMETEQARFKSRASFAYAVLTPDGSRERGSVYVQPSPVEGYDAVVRMWVTKADYDAGFDSELYEWVTDWIRTDWPFKKVAYPGRAIAWAAWDPLVAANKTGASPAD